jgi:carbon monoxide dehydrogenase subunit G
MKITMADKLEINAPIGTALKFAVNLREVASCIPTMQNFIQIDDKNFTMDVTLGMAFIKGIFKIKGTMLEQQGKHLVYGIDGSGVGSTMSVTITFDMNSKSESTTQIEWSAVAELNGLVSGVSELVLRKVTGDEIEKIIANVKTHLEGSKT